MDAIESVHEPVMLKEVLEWMVRGEGGVYLDGTLGAAGHTRAILEKSPLSHFVGIDRDAEILEYAQVHLKNYEGRVSVYQSSYDCFEEWFEKSGGKKFRGILVDLGVSSLQLDQADRGFSFSKEAFLDMRMSREATETAADIVNTRSQKDLENLFRTLGEERFSGRIARVIVERRRKRKIETTSELEELIWNVVPKFKGRQTIHPATRVFQALRIAVNRELERLESFLQKAPHYLESQGRLVVIAYHSLEDRPVKQAFQKFESAGLMKRLTKKPLVASDEEVEKNPRARSAKMRVAEKME